MALFGTKAKAEAHAIEADAVAKRAEAVATTVTATQSLSPTDQAEVIQLVLTPTQGTIDDLWRMLVSSLCGLLIISAVALFAIEFGATGQGSSAPMVTIFTATITGLLGLFVKAPNGSDRKTSGKDPAVPAKP